MRHALAVLLVLWFTGCDGGGPAPIVEGRVSGLVIDPATGATYVSLRAAAAGDPAVVPAADAGTTRWDLSFEGAEVRLNGGSSGPGTAIGFVVSAPFSSRTDALQEDLAYRRDGDSPCPSGPPRVVCTGRGDGLLDAVDGQIMPVLGQVLVLRLAEGRGYAKLQVESVTEGEGGAPVLTFRYVVNPDGSSFVE